MDNWNVPLWYAFAFITSASFLFLFIKDNGIQAYSMTYIFGFNAVMWCICGLIYVGNYSYNKLKKKENG